MIYCFHMAMIVWHDLNEVEETTMRERETTSRLGGDASG
jgi:hypothetical protein